MSCILALDGFYMDGRNVRSSYGTSKYCSAFIKNVRCNNPECTYLHNMGHIEDTFTKQEIQAGYVTSGRDVLARQQQIVQQALSAASGAAGSTPRRRTGGGGPSGTGKASSNPIFPPPSFDEPARASAAVVPTPPTITPQARSTSTAATAPTASSGFPAISSGSSASASTNTTSAAKPNSTGASTNNNNSASTIPTAPKGAIASLAVPQTTRKSTGATAASVVAGAHSASSRSEPPAPHTTLTPLTPLKRSSTASKGASKAVSNSASETQKHTNTRAGSQKKANGLKSGSQPGSPKNIHLPVHTESISSIGGDVISAPATVPQPIIGNNQILNPHVTVNGDSRGQQSSGLGSFAPFGSDGLGGLGGEVFDGPLQSSSFNVRSAIGSGMGGKWDSVPGGDPVYPANHHHQAPSWGSTIGSHAPQNIIPGANTNSIGGGVIGGGTIGPGNVQNRTGSSALASMLGINLPSGSGSLHESTTPLWTPGPAPQSHMASLHGNSMPLQGMIGGTAISNNNNNNLIGGIPIGGGNQQMQTTVNGGNNSDIALLQSLLPGVHITSGGNFQGSGFGSIGSGSNNSASVPPHRNGSGSASLAAGNTHQGFGLHQHQPIGTIGQGHDHTKQGQQAPGSIW